MKKEFNNKTGWLSLPAKYKKPRGVTPRLSFLIKARLMKLESVLRKCTSGLDLSTVNQVLLNRGVTS
jgi:hypothetical protein